MAGHAGDHAVAVAAIDDEDPTVRLAALGALERLGRLRDATVRAALDDDDLGVRRRAIEFAASRPAVDLLPMLADDPTIVEVTCFALGERAGDDPATLDALSSVATNHDDALCREAAIAALGSIGHPSTSSVVVAAMDDKATVRRRAVVALAAFDGEAVEDAIQVALTDRDWQVRQVAEDLLDT